LTDPATTNEEPADASEEFEQVDLKNPLLAAGLALLLPGLGHLYQQRYAKAVLFMVCILPMYFFGWSIGGGKVVYAQWRPNAPILEQRWHYVCQFWTGVPAWPALVQTMFNQPFGDEFMVAPELSDRFGGGNEESDWHAQYHGYYELGTVYTMIAGILNLLVIFDAVGGPIGSVIRSDEEKKKLAAKNIPAATAEARAKS